MDSRGSQTEFVPSYSNDRVRLGNLIDFSERRAEQRERFPAVEDLLDRLTLDTMRVANGSFGIA